jgi:hypothetical protein
MICVALGIGYSLMLYFRDRTFEDQPTWLRGIMAALRFLSVSVLSALLLSPLLRLTSEEVQEPLVVIAQDLSTSALQNMNNTDSTAYVTGMQEMIQSLKSKYQVYQIGFGENVVDSINWNFNQQVTDIDQAFAYISDNFSDQNLGAVVLATDGIFNRGRNPIYSGFQMKAPLYSIGLGDTTQRTDLLVKHVFHNKIAFLGDRFVIQVDLLAKNLEGRTTTLRLERIDGINRSTIEQIPIKITENQFFTTQEFIIDAEKPGVQRYRVRMAGMEDEITYSNNAKDIFIEVIDGRQKILVLGNSPHPDIAAIKSMLELNENYEVTTAILSEFVGNVNDFDVIVMHQIPGTSGGKSMLSQINALKKPRLFILGSQSNLTQFNSAQGLLIIQGGNRSGNEVQAIVDPTFNLFKISETLSAQMGRFAPAVAPFGQYTQSPAGQVLAYQKIGNVETQYPLIMMGEDNQIKTGVVAAEGIWKWKLYDYLQNENHDGVQELISKTIQYLTIKDDKRRFRSSPSKNLFMDNEEIIFDAELYNNSYELINVPDVFLVVQNAEGNEFNYTFNRIGQTYQLNMGKFPDGSYRYTAYVDYDGQRRSVNGRFAVQPIQLESFETVADHVTLNRLSENQNGKLFYPNELDQVFSSIQNDEQIKPILYQKIRTRSIIHLKWIFALLLLMITAEWFLRRFFGGY